MKKIVLILFIVLVPILFSCVVSAQENTEYIVRLKSDVTLFAAKENTELKPLIPKLGLYTASDISNPDAFEFIEEDAPVELFDTYDYSAVMTHGEYEVTGIKSMWDIGVYGSDVRIGVIDSGCKPHKALGENLCEGANFADDSEGTYDNIGHGTAVCGIAAAGYGYGKCIGTAHKAEIVPLKFIDRDSEGNTVGGTTKRLASAIMSAVDDFDCDIINMSCGTIDSNTLKLAVDYAASNGAVIVAAVGNSGNSDYSYPAAYDNVIGVGSVNKEKSHSVFSNTNSSVFITAPGEKVNILTGETGIEESSGTSFSAPYVSGIIADMLDIKPSLTPDEVTDIISSVAEDLGDEGYDEVFGYGLIRADNIIDYMLKNCECFASEIDLCREDDFYEVRFRFNDNAEHPDCIFAEYTDGILKCLNIETQYVDDNILMLRLKKTAGASYKYFVWNSFEGMAPVTVNASY